MCLASTENGVSCLRRVRTNKSRPSISGSLPWIKKLCTKDEVLAELMEEPVALKKSWGDLRGPWTPHDTRDQGTTSSLGEGECQQVCGAGLLAQWKPKPFRQGKGFQQPLAPHEHWHVDISSRNRVGAFYNLCSLLEGYRRYLVHGEIRESMTWGEQASPGLFPTTGGGFGNQAMDV